MTFMSAGYLWLLVLVAALAVAYVVVQFTRRQHVARFTNLALLDAVAPRRSWWQRHISATLFCLMCATLVVAVARPAMEVQVPRERATVIVAIDVSLSMAAQDVAPNRMRAAQESAQEFVDSLPERFNVGLVAFSGIATVVSSPTQDHQAVVDTIGQLELGPGTAIGEAVFASLQAIESFDAGAGPDPPPAAVVLLSDGENTAGRDVGQAGRAASDAEVPVSTIAFGTGASFIEIDGILQEVNIDVATLNELAEQTGGRFYAAESDVELTEVYDNIGSSLGVDTEYQEIIDRFVAAALLMALLAAVSSLAWSTRLP